MSIYVKVAHLNVHQPAPDEVRERNLDKVIYRVLSSGGVGMLNEIGKEADHKYIESDPRLGSYLYGELGIIWDASRFDVVYTAKYKIMQGGYVGADGAPGGDDRRVGPSRWLLVVVLRDKETGICFPAAVTHLVAKADTTAKWRRAIRAASIKVTGYRLSLLAKKYPNGFLTGDMNYRPAVLDFPFLDEVQLPIPPTMGRSHYDRAYVWGKTRVLSILPFSAESDHLGFSFVVEIDGASSPLSPVKPEVPETPARPSRTRRKPPVRNPWARRSRRWRRRHPILWRRILRWRRKHQR